MPTPQAEPSCYPEDVLNRPRRDVDSRWWCLHTKPRQEKAAARDLMEHRVAHYLPQVVHHHVTPGGRRLTSSLPLFPGYLFLFGDDEGRAVGLHCGRLVSILHVADQEGLERDLRQVERLLRSGLTVGREASFQVGQRVRVASGPLEGMVGTVLRRGRSRSFVAAVQFLGTGATVELQDWQVEPISEARDGRDR